MEGAGGARAGRAGSHSEVLLWQAEEVGLFRSVSEQLLQGGGWPAPHQHLFGLLAAHGASRLLQVALGPCSPRTAAGDTQVRAPHPPAHHTPFCGASAGAPATAPVSPQRWREALAGTLMRILHNLAAALQARETGHPLAVETPLVSLCVHRWEAWPAGREGLAACQ